MEKIGLILAYKSSNYGCQLQAYATQFVIEALGFETCIIDYKASKYSVRDRNFDLGLIRYLLNSIAERKIRKKTRENILNPTFLQNKEERKKKSIEFIDNNLKNIVTIRNYNELKVFAKRFSAFLIGSDQKWLPGFCYDKISSLTFVPKGCKRVSFATSLGVSEYPSYCKNASKKVWKLFDYLSVREETGASIVNKICGFNRCISIIDPTYLITKEKWESLFPPLRVESEKYALCYFLGNDIKSKEMASYHAKKLGLKLISIMTDESFTDYDITFADKVLTGVSPAEFINLIRFADIVFTDSFHGMTFSIINNKEFYVFYRKRDDAKQSRNSRIDNILNLFGLASRLIDSSNTNSMKQNECIIDYVRINKILINERNKAYLYLKKALLNEND